MMRGDITAIFIHILLPPYKAYIRIGSVSLVSVNTDLINPFFFQIQNSLLLPIYSFGHTYIQFVFKYNNMQT